MTQVKANRAIMVRSEEERKNAPPKYHSNKIAEGKSAGWSLIYCKGPEGEQLEFVKVLGPVQQTFQEAFERHRTAIER